GLHSRQSVGLLRLTRRSCRLRRGFLRLFTLFLVVFLLRGLSTTFACRRSFRHSWFHDRLVGLSRLRFPDGAGLLRLRLAFRAIQLALSFVTRLFLIFDRRCVCGRPGFTHSTTLVSSC